MWNNYTGGSEEIEEGEENLVIQDFSRGSL